MTDYDIERIFDIIDSMVSRHDNARLKIKRLQEIRGYVDELIDEFRADDEEDHPADRFPSYRGD